MSANGAVSHTGACSRASRWSGSAAVKETPLGARRSVRGRRPHPPGAARRTPAATRTCLGSWRQSLGHFTCRCRPRGYRGRRGRSIIVGSHDRLEVPCQGAKLLVLDLVSWDERLKHGLLCAASAANRSSNSSRDGWISSVVANNSPAATRSICTSWDCWLGILRLVVPRGPSSQSAA